MKPIPQTDLFLNALGEIELQVLTVDQNLCFSVADAGIRNSELAFQRERHHAGRRLTGLSIPDVVARHTNFHVVPFLPHYSAA